VGAYSIAAIAFTSVRVSFVNMICLGFELVDRRPRLDKAGVRRWDSWTPYGVRRRRAKWTAPLIASN